MWLAKAGVPGSWERPFDPYTLFPTGDDMNMNKMANIKIDDLKLPPDVFSVRLKRRARLRELITGQMPHIDQAVEPLKLDQHYQQALDLVVSGRAREAFNLGAEPEAMRGKIRANNLW